jgi:hypothetical protein
MNPALALAPCRRPAHCTGIGLVTIGILVTCFLPLAVGCAEPNPYVESSSGGAGGAMGGRGGTGDRVATGGTTAGPGGSDNQGGTGQPDAPWPAPAGVDSSLESTGPAADGLTAELDAAAPEKPAVPSSCGNSVVDPGESCDPLSTCPSTCPPIGCQLRTLVSEGTCMARCESGAMQTICGNGDGCCPSGCSALNDSDCVLPNRMFVTSRTYTSDLGGLTGADQKCADQARLAGLAGTFIAFLSTSAMPAMGRFGNARGWVRIDGRPFGDTQQDLLRGRIFYPPVIDEFGKTIVAPAVFTGTQFGGMPGTTANDWQGTGDCDAGDAFNGAGRWYQYFTGCTPAHLYCFEIARTATVSVPPPQNGRFAFVSKGPFDPSLGIAAADEVCGSEATAAALPGSFRAFLGTATAAPVSRVSLIGPPWWRTDGVQLVETAGDLATNKLLAPVLVTAARTYDAQSSSVWTGAVEPGKASAETCSNWTNKSATATAVVGSAAWLSRWSSDGSYRAPCDKADNRIYCFQQ